MAQTIPLPTPDTTGGLPANHALALRHSTREYSDREPDFTTISSLLWATCGINRPADGHRTNPTAMNWQEVDAYLFTKSGVYLYDPAANALVEVAQGDHRALLAGTPEFSQDFVLQAPCAVLITIDTTKVAPGERGLQAALIDAGIADQNINIFCAANGLVTVPRITMDTAGIRNLLRLPPTTIPVINNPVGYPQ